MTVWTSGNTPLRCFVLPVLSLAMLFTIGGASQARSQTVLTLDSCLSLAAGNSPQLRMADNALRLAELSRSELRTTALPQLSATLGATLTPIPPTFGYDPVVTNGGEISGRIVVRQSLYDAGIRSLKSDQLGADLERLAHERRLIQLDLGLAVKQSFAEGLRAQEEAGLELQSLQQLEAYLGLVKRLYSGGTAGYTDVLKTQLQVSTARVALSRALESAAASKISLQELIGIRPDTALVLGGTLDDPLPAMPESLESNVVSSNLDMTVAELLIRRSLVDREIVGHELFPDISLVADAGYLTSGENLRLPASDRLRAFGYSVGIGIELPILNWGATSLRMEQRDLATDDLRQKTELLRRSLTTEARRLQLQLEGELRRLTLVRQNIVTAGENFVLTKSKYAAGASLALEVLAAQQILAESHLTEIQTLADIRTLAAKIERLNAH